ncbi:MAG: SpoIID/LytB domain-containing protein [bacterium]|nr:SpoIID/LytB domain-containing protein [bacterium]
MRKILLLVLVVFFLIFPFKSRADEYDDIAKQLSDLKSSLDSSKKATATNEKNLTQLNAQLTDIKNKVASLGQEIVKKEAEVKKGEEALTYQQKLLNERAVSYYKNLSNNPGSVVDILVSENISTSLQNFFYQKFIIDEDRRTIIKIVLYVKNLDDKKKSLEAQKVKLDVIKAEVDAQSQFLAGEVSKSKKYEGELSSKIAQLSAQQQQLISQRQAGLNIPRSAGTTVRGCSDDRDIDPGFSPRLAFFTYGAPHRNGLNQYGAYGRAKAGQNEEQILEVYFPGKNLRKDYDQNIQISTTTGHTFSIEDYVKRIYEVPDSWTDNNSAVLKAQAVAARTYALNVTNNGSKQICTSEQCQVFKPEPKGGNWDAAVEATKGWVLMDGGGPAFTQYASTHGGYIQNLGKFDGRDGNPSNFAELNERAYDKESPWFYCDWGARPEYSKTAWLKGQEVADITNVLMLVKRDSSVGEHLYQVDKPNPAGTDTWGADKVKIELRNRGVNPFNSIDSLSVSADFGSGKTTGVTVSGDGGTQTFDPGEFKNFFNLRAPANIQIVGPLYNVERR